MADISTKLELVMGYNMKMNYLLGADRANELNTLKEEAKEERTALDSLSQEMQNAVQEQNEYIIEIENMQEEMEALQNEYSNQIQATDDKYFDLKNKELAGTLTEEEQQELASLEAERNGLSEEGNSKLKNLNSSIVSTKQNYQGSEDKLNSANDLISQTKTTIDGLSEWNENNSVENGGGTVCEKFIKTNNTVINDLSSKTSSLSEQVNKYSKSYSFLKN